MDRRAVSQMRSLHHTIRGNHSDQSNQCSIISDNVYSLLLSDFEKEENFFSKSLYSDKKCFTRMREKKYTFLAIISLLNRKFWILKFM